MRGRAPLAAGGAGEDRPCGSGGAPRRGTAVGRAHGYGKSGTLWRLMALAPTSPKPQHVRYTHREANWSRSPLWGMTGTMGLAGAARGVTPLLPRRTESVAGHGHDSEEHKGVGGDHSASCAGGAPVATVVCRSCGSGGHPAVGRTLVARHTALTRLAVAAVSVRGMTCGGLPRLWPRQHTTLYPSCLVRCGWVAGSGYETFACGCTSDGDVPPVADDTRSLLSAGGVGWTEGQPDKVSLATRVLRARDSMGELCVCAPWCRMHAVRASAPWPRAGRVGCCAAPARLDPCAWRFAHGPAHGCDGVSSQTMQRCSS